MALSSQTFSVNHVFTRGEVLCLREEDVVTNCFGNLKKITKIYVQRNDINGKAFACFYQEFGNDSKMSNSVQEGEPIHTV